MWKINPPANLGRVGFAYFWSSILQRGTSDHPVTEDLDDFSDLCALAMEECSGER